MDDIIVGMYIKVRVAAGAKEEKLVRKSKDHFDVFVCEEAQRNMANRRVTEILAKEFNVVKGKVRIVSGHHSSGKILAIDVE